MADPNLKPFYETSHALVIGINHYKTCSPLEYAVNDAEEVARFLETKFSFTPNNIHLLVDNKATKSNILNYYLSLTSTTTNDRVLIYYAGHGFTYPSRHGEIGYLIPQNGDTGKLHTLIRWDELTRNADLIKAKHILFIMDACYGGLAISRAMQPGSKRFQKDMLLRYSRQVITAGKANETVADLGGPLPGHSIFTGYFLEALSGKAEYDEGIITANGVMAYVYHMVGHDLYSQQTPHFGFLDGDGDFIFKSPVLNIKENENEVYDKDVLITIPAVLHEENWEEPMTFDKEVKEYLSDSRFKIKLHDLITEKLVN